MEPSLSGSSVVTQHGHGSMTDTLAAKQPGRSAPQHAKDQLQVQMQHCTQGGEVSAGASEKGRDVGLQRLTAALTAVLSSGMASDFVEGLKPVLHNGQLAISTFIKLDHDPEPVFIGMYPSLPAAVTAQKQSSELIGQLPPGVARKLIREQLAHTDPTSGPQGATQQQCQAGGPHVPPERWQSNTTSDSTAVGTGSSSQAAEGDGTPKGTAQQKQQQDHSSRDRQHGQSAQAPQAAGQQQQGTTQSSAAAIHSTLAAAAAAAAAGGQSAPTPGSIAAAVASPSPRPGGALTDDVIRMLLNKGLHELTVAQQQQHPHGHQGEQDSSWQQQQDLLLHQLPPDAEQSLLDIFNTPVSTPGSGTALAEALQLLPSPGQSQQQQQRHAALMQQLAASPMDSQRLLSSLHSSLRDSQGAQGMGGPPASSQQQQYAQQAAQYPTSMGNAAAGDYSSSLPPLLPLVSQGPVGAMPHGGDIGLALDGALENAMLRGAGGPWGPASAAMSLPMAYSQAPAAYTTAGFAAGVPEQMGLAGFQQQQQGYGVMPGGYGGAGMEYGMGGYAGGGYNMKQEDLSAMGMGMREMQEMQFAGAAAYAGADFDHARGLAAAAAAAAAGGDGEGVGDKRKRAAVDPRVNCVKSVQYRVSRFPSELHDLCIEHWERARCARVVCNDIQGVMSVQNGRCVVTFNQNNQEVVKGVADYLRYAGEERIKKWRRHVRMVDFPRPGNRSGELMTAEEFLCIVGYQSEQGGGKRARGDYD